MPIDRVSDYDELVSRKPEPAADLSVTVKVLSAPEQVAPQSGDVTVETA